MNAHDEILDPDLENGLVLKQIEDDPINDADIDEVALLETDQLQSGLSRSKFSARALSRGQITLRARLNNNKLGGG